MPKVYVTIGPNGAGKSTWAKQQEAVYVGFDDTHSCEKAFDIINSDLTKDYIYEAVNTKADDWFYVMIHTPCFEHVGVFFDTTPEECKRRCIEKNREDLVQFVDRDYALIQEAKPFQKRYFDEVIHV